MPQTVDEAVEQLERALAGPSGELVQVDRISFERTGPGLVRWTLWQAGRLLYSASGRPGDLAGFLACTNVLLQVGAD